MFPPPGRTRSEPPFSGVGVLVVTLGPLSGVTPLMSRLSTVTHLSRAPESEPLQRSGTPLEWSVVSESGPQRPRIGVFGGTFDPPHIGHLVSAIDVRDRLGLDCVILMVANIPWQKAGTRRISPAEDRLAMVRAAVADVPGLVAGDHEIRAGGPSYTADTLAELATEFVNAEFFTIVGADAAAGLSTWERYEEVVERSTVVVVDRPGAYAAPATLPGGAEWTRIEVPHLEVSSTDLRSRIARISICSLPFGNGGV